MHCTLRGGSKIPVPYLDALFKNTKTRLKQTLFANETPSSVYTCTSLKKRKKLVSLIFACDRLRHDIYIQRIHSMLCKHSHFLIQ